MRLPSTLLPLISFLCLLVLSTRNAHSKILCIEKERQALIDFKLSFVADPMDYLSTWSIDNDDCCEWDGVECATDTGHVTSLDFSGGMLESYELRPSLLEFQHLTALSLNGNQCTMRIPKFIGSLSKLNYLDLSLAGFFGEIPPHLGNLSRLEFLDLRLEFLDLGSDQLYADNLKWLSKLSSIGYLDLSTVNLSNAIDWVSTLKMLPTLSSFFCSSCSLPPPHLSSISHANSSTSLHSLDLSNNNMSSSTFSCLFNGTNNLQTLDLGHMKLENNLHEFLGALTGKARYSLESLGLEGNNLSSLPYEVMVFPSLMTLTLSQNQLNSVYPYYLSSLTSLTSLDLSFNRISGSLQEIFQYLPTNLTSLYLSSNNLYGAISDAHLSKFFKLNTLELSDNNLLEFNFSKSWVPPFQLNTLDLGSCKVGPSFPNWILTQKKLEYLYLPNSMISGGIPEAFWDFSTRLTGLNLSHNSISCVVPNSNLSFSNDNFLYLDLSSNAFHGPIPLFLFTASILYLSNNRFSSFPSFDHGLLSQVPTILIYLSNNHLSGSLPNWIFQFDELFVLKLDNNKLSGTLPEAIGSLWRITALHLSNNNFSGQIPMSMKNCSHLTILELQNNKLSGVVPFWLGESMTQLIVLNLGSNIFSGNLPSSLCHIQSLQILDLSDNKMSGSIPSCVYNFTHMATDKGLNLSSMSPDGLEYFYTNSNLVMIDGASFTWKGVLVTLDSQNLIQRNAINLSSNLLVGEIPIGLAALKGLRSLDLSRNDLNGSIPDTIGQLTSLEVLKISSNRLRGEIPQSLARLAFLGTLDLSNNNLSGRIPIGTQLQGFNASSYGGNPKLCGEPLPAKCPGDENDDQIQPRSSKDAHDDESFDIQAFLAALGMGFVLGLLGVLGILHFNRPWRLAFFQLGDNIADRIFVARHLFQSRIKRSLCFRKGK